LALLELRCADETDDAAEPVALEYPKTACSASLASERRTNSGSSAKSSSLEAAKAKGSVSRASRRTDMNDAASSTPSRSRHPITHARLLQCVVIGSRKSLS